MNDIVQSQEKSMEGHLQFLFKVRSLKCKSFRKKVQSTNGIFVVVPFLKEVVSYQFIRKRSIFKANCYLFCLFFLCVFLTYLSRR